MAGIAAIVGIVVIVGCGPNSGRYKFERVVPGTYIVAGFADAVPIQKTVDIAGPRVDVSLR